MGEKVVLLLVDIIIITQLEKDLYQSKEETNLNLLFFRMKEESEKEKRKKTIKCKYITRRLKT